MITIQRMSHKPLNPKPLNPHRHKPKLSTLSAPSPNPQTQSTGKLHGRTPQKHDKLSTMI